MPARKEKKNRRAGGQDKCQTPPYALAPLLPYLPRTATIWEPCCGDGNIVAELTRQGHTVVGSDIDDGRDCLTWHPDHFDMIITNPPYSQPLKNKILRRFYAMGQPFAVLVKVDTLGTKGWQRLAKDRGFEVMLLDERIDFKMPNKGYGGKGADWAAAWVCWRILLEPVVFGHIVKPDEIPNFSQDGVGIKLQEPLF